MAWSQEEDELLITNPQYHPLGEKKEEPRPFRKDNGLISPDKQWEYKCVARMAFLTGGNTVSRTFGPQQQSAPAILKGGTNEVALDLSEELDVSQQPALTMRVRGPARVEWAPDSKRFAFNYSPTHALHMDPYKTVAFYQLRGEKWVALRSPEDDLVKLAQELLPKKIHKSHDELIPDIVKVRNWTDASTAILFSAWHPWQYSSHSNQLKASLLLTLKFNENGNWKIVKKHRMSEKEIEKFNSED